MPRKPRVAPGGLAYHVINRGVGRGKLFFKASDYEAFERIMDLAMQRCPTRLCAYCLMPNHWHLIIWPRKDGELTDFMRWLTHTHAMRFHAHRYSSGSGHIYQGRFKSFPIQQDEHFLSVCRYVERNAVRAGLVRQAENWRWCSLWRRESGDRESLELLGEWPVARLRNWRRQVNVPLPHEELEMLRRCVQKSAPFGSVVWQRITARRLGLGHTLRERGRPKRARK